MEVIHPLGDVRWIYRPRRTDMLRGVVDDWLTVTKHDGESIDELACLNDLYNEVFSFLTQEWKMPSLLSDLSEWITSGVWLRGKAGTGEKTHIEVDRVEGKTRKYKGVDAALLSDHDI